jgi:dihydrofolate reductase
MSAAIVRLSVCVSLDGRVATSVDTPPNQEKFGGWTSEDDKRVFNDNVDWADLLLVGMKTLEQCPRLVKMGRPVVVVSRKTPPKWQILTAPKIVHPDKNSLISWLKVFDDKKILLCGGVMTYGTFLQFGLVDEMSITVEPIILNTGPSFTFQGLINKTTEQTHFQMVSSNRLNKRGTILLLYKKVGKSIN